MRILLVEDAPDIREVFTVLLRVEGADVTATGSGREATELANRRDFDVVLSDLGLPRHARDVLIRQILTTAHRVARHRGHGLRRALPDPCPAGRGRRRLYKAGGMGPHSGVAGQAWPGRLRLSVRAAPGGPGGTVP